MVSSTLQSLAAIEDGDGPYAFSESSEVVDLVDEAVQQQETFATQGGTGAGRSDPGAGARIVQRDIAGRLTLHPSPATLGHWLPRILGAAAVDGVFVPAQSLPAFGLMVDRVAKVFLHARCYVSKAVLRGGNAGPLELLVDLVAMERTTLASGSFPSLVVGDQQNLQPYVTADLGLTFAGETRDCVGFELVIDNALKVRRVHSLQPVSITPGRRSIRLKTLHPFDATNTSLTESATAGAAAALQLTHPAGVTTFDFARLLTPATDPESPPANLGAGDFVLDLNSMAVADGDTAELEVSHLV